MTEKTQKEMINKLYQTVIGLPDNPHDNGLVGVIHEIKENVKDLNGTVKKHTGQIAVLGNKVEDLREADRTLKLTRNQSIIGGSGIIGVILTLIVAIGRSLGWW